MIDSDVITYDVGADGNSQVAGHGVGAFGKDGKVIAVLRRRGDAQHRAFLDRVAAFDENAVIGAGADDQYLHVAVGVGVNGDSVANGNGVLGRIDFSVNSCGSRIEDHPIFRCGSDDSVIGFYIAAGCAYGMNHSGAGVVSFYPDPLGFAVAVTKRGKLNGLDVGILRAVKRCPCGINHRAVGSTGSVNRC